MAVLVLCMIIKKKNNSFFFSRFFFLPPIIQEVHDVQSPEELERFMLDHGEQIIDTLGQEVDRIERNIKVYK